MSESYFDYLMLFQQLGDMPPTEIQNVVQNDLEKIKNRKVYMPDATIRPYHYRRGEDNGQNYESDTDSITNDDENKERKTKQKQNSVFDSSTLSDTKNKKGKRRGNNKSATKDEDESESERETILI